MAILIGWMLCPECGEIDYREIVPLGIGGSDSYCTYLWCEKRRLPYLASLSTGSPA